MPEQPQLEALQKRLPNLEELWSKLEAAKTALDEACKTVAENSRVDKSVIRKFLNARMSEKYAEQKARAEQLNLLFEEIPE